MAEEAPEMAAAGAPGGVETGATQPLQVGFVGLPWGRIAQPSV